MTPNRPKSAKKSGSRKRSAGAMQTSTARSSVALQPAVETQNLDRGGARGCDPCRNRSRISALERINQEHGERFVGHLRRQRDLRRLPSGAKRSFGTARSIGSPCNTQATKRCWAISPVRASTITACIRASFAGTESFSSRPTGPTATSPPLKSSTPSASSRCSNISSSFPTAGCRRCRSPGTAGRRSRAASAGFISTRTRRSSTTTCCTGPG